MEATAQSAIEADIALEGILYETPATPPKRSGFNITASQQEGKRMKQTKTGGATANAGAGSGTLSAPNAVNGSPWSSRAKVEVKLYFWELTWEDITFALLIGGQTIGIGGAIKGQCPFNANGVFMENSLISSYFRSPDFLINELKQGDKWLLENYPGAPGLDSIIGPFQTATGAYKGCSFSIRPFFADTNVAIDSSWKNQVATQKAMVLANEQTIRVEPSPVTAWIGRQVATWNVLKISEDASNALMLYREWKWTTTGEPPKSALPIEIAAREALQVDEHA